MFTSLRFLCFGNTPLPSLNSSTPQRSQSRSIATEDPGSTARPGSTTTRRSSLSSLSPIEELEEPSTPSSPNTNSNNLYLSSSIGSYPIPSSLMREVESIRAHILQQKTRHQNQNSRRNKQKTRRQRQQLQQVAVAQPTISSIPHTAKSPPILYNDVSSPYAEDTSVFELKLAGENNKDVGEQLASDQLQDGDDGTSSSRYDHLPPEEQMWNDEAAIDTSTLWGLDDLISQGYLETCDNSLAVWNPQQQANTDELYSISKELGVNQNTKLSGGDTGWWLVRHVDPKALSKLGGDCVIL
ncbi:hypothetical protein TWF481_007982 [Arthrobotrys musiformis]|uniref:Uncharacterized protein n=1 Tax=Arthrobotrys musiformis TaxID=47236 RepID=A0AAV9W5X7_9PEZI